MKIPTYISSAAILGIGAGGVMIATNDTLRLIALLITILGTMMTTLSIEHDVR